MKKTETSIYQSVVHLLIAFLALTAFSTFFLWGVWRLLGLERVAVSNMVSHLQYFFTHKADGAFYAFSGAGVILALFSIKALMMLLKAKEPIATLDAMGMRARNGEVYRWDEIQGLSIDSIKASFVTVRSDLVVYLQKGKKKLPYVRLTQERLADLIEEARK